MQRQGGRYEVKDGKTRRVESQKPPAGPHRPRHQDGTPVHPGAAAQERPPKSEVSPPTKPKAKEGTPSEARSAKEG